MRAKDFLEAVTLLCCSDDDGVNNLKSMMQRAEIGLLPLARTSTDGHSDAAGGGGGLSLKARNACVLCAHSPRFPYTPLPPRHPQVLPMTTHSLHVSQGSAPVLAHRLLPLPDRSGAAPPQAGANPFHSPHSPPPPPPYTPPLASALVLMTLKFAHTLPKLWACDTFTAVVAAVPAGGYLRGSDPVEVPPPHLLAPHCPS